MPRVGLAFYTAAVLYLVAGTVWGAIMGATENFSLASAHAHLNLVGWVSMALMGTFYSLRVNQRYHRLPWINFTLSNLGVLTLIPALVGILTGHLAALPIIAAGAILVISGAVTFLVAVVMCWRQSSPV
jgi:hypothetical protein